MNEAYKQSLRQEYNVSVAGTTGNAQIFASFGYLNNKGIIDGTVLAEFYKGSTLVGQADLVLPLWGLKHGGEAVQLEGICLTGGEEGTTYRVAYKARHLFEMEA